jgi:alpha-glucan,water dikinase
MASLRAPTRLAPAGAARNVAPRALHQPSPPSAGRAAPAAPAPRLASAARPARGAPARAAPAAAAAAAAVAPPPAAPDEVVSAQRFADAGISITVTRGGGAYTVDIAVAGEPRPDLVLHWAVNNWSEPPPAAWPAGTAATGDGKAVRTSFGAAGAVRVSFPEADAPARLVFVLNEGDRWINAGASDFAAQLRPPALSDIVDEVISKEAHAERWSLFSRVCLATELLDGALAAGPPGAALIFTWLRLSSQRQLDWFRGTNYQSKDAAHAMQALTERVAAAARSAAEPQSRALARAALAGLPRGGGNGDDIRHGILNVMREHGIAEGHRPGIHDDFLESWHQKLHTNTTPDDVAICEAYLAFLHSGDMGDFWRVAWENGKLTPEILEAMDHPVKATPVHLPQMIGSMKHYLWILKTTHAGADLDVMFEMSKAHLGGELAGAVGDILAHRHEWWVPGKIVEVRRALAPVWRAEGAPRDVLLLDIALDEYLRLCVERADKAAMAPDDLWALAQLVLDNAAIAAESKALVAAGDLWRRAGAAPGRWESREWGLQALAAADHAALCLSAYADGLTELVQPHAARFGADAGVDPLYVANFGEEVVRGLPAFVLAPLLRHLGAPLRASAGVGAWSVVARPRGGDGAAAAGRVAAMEDLSGVQGADMAEPTVIIAQRLSGNEDIPAGVTAVITGSATDVLSHVAIRARAQGVLLATCFDPDELARLSAMDGGYASAALSAAGNVLVAAAAAPAKAAGKPAGGGGKAAPLRLAPPAAAAAAWALAEADFAPGRVGGKALNLAAVRGALPAWVSVPASVALPFGAFERALADPANAAAADAVAALEAELAAAPAGGGVPPALRALRVAVRSTLAPPSALAAELGAAAAAAGLAPAGAWAAPGAPAFAPVWAAICAVWASKWNDRAWLSRRALGVPEADLFMSVLLQQVVDARYAFVLHTADPLTGAAGRLAGEAVAGLGEALVANFPGRALAFVADTGALAPGAAAGTAAGPGDLSAMGLELLGLPSKPDVLRAAPASAPGHGLIARSDSNGEDLEGFAGAGLYSSVPATPFARGGAAYAEEPLFWDAAFRAATLGRVAAAGAAVEAARGGAQDVEGCVDGGGRVWVVQARAQVLH